MLIFKYAYAERIEFAMELPVERIFSLKYKDKAAIAKIALGAMAAAFELASKRVPELQKELKSWDNGRTFALGVLAKGPGITMRNENGVIKLIGEGVREGTDVVFYFKNIDSALMVFAGMMGAHTASIQHRTIVHGDIGMGMEALRAMNIVQAYLFPGFILKKTFKTPPKMNGAQMLTKIGIMASLAPVMIANGSK